MTTMADDEPEPDDVLDRLGEATAAFLDQAMARVAPEIRDAALAAAARGAPVVVAIEISPNAQATLCVAGQELTRLAFAPPARPN